MTERRDEAWVLGTHELGEADLIVTLFCEHHGKVRGVARSARRSRRRFGGALQPLTRIRVTWHEREGRELHQLQAMEPLRSFAAMQGEPGRQAACAVLAELGAAFGHEGQADPPGFRLMGAVLEALEDGGDVWSVVRYFEYWTLRLHGLLPDVERCADCDDGGPVLVDRHGAPRCEACAAAAGAEGRPLGDEARRFIAEAARLGPARLSPARRTATGPGGPLEALLRGRLEAYAERRFHSYRHLRALAPAWTGPGRGRRWPPIR